MKSPLVLLLLNHFLGKENILFHIKLIAHCSSVIITWIVCYSACAKVLCYKHGRSTGANFMSSTAFCGRILSAPRKKDGESGTTKRKTVRDFYDVEISEVDTTANS